MAQKSPTRSGTHFPYEDLASEVTRRRVTMITRSGILSSKEQKRTRLPQDECGIQSSATVTYWTKLQRDSWKRHLQKSSLQSRWEGSLQRLLVKPVPPSVRELTPGRLLPTQKRLIHLNGPVHPL
ncbi:myocilin opposite strand protein isoform X1 [Rhinolophus sinicus]|uniref:myocilin opposite strand protein isoform X1 n=1 Tax=Rhinolophus sinicus TaxID=89399 RepID=UPI003D7AA1C4